MKETGWKKTAGNGSDGKRTEGKKSFGRGEKATGFSKNSAKVGVNGEKQEKLLVKCLELRINGAHMGTGNEM